MKKAVYPGSFDPPTYGHLDIITRASSVFDELVIAIMKNPKKKSAFTEEERIEMLRKITRDLPNVSVVVGHGLTVRFAHSIGAQVLIRGIRAVMDYEYELQQATANMYLDDSIETVFFVARPRFSFLSSSLSKAIALNNGDLSKFIPEAIIEEVEQELNPLKKKIRL